MRIATILFITSAALADPSPSPRPELHEELERIKRWAAPPASPLPAVPPPGMTVLGGGSHPELPFTGWVLAWDRGKAVIIDADGRIQLKGGAGVDEASREFWELIQKRIDFCRRGGR